MEQYRIAKQEPTNYKRLLVDEMKTDDIKKLERRIVKIYEECYHTKDVVLKERAAECIGSLLMQRWQMMHESIVWDDDFIAKLVAMNEKMKQSLLEMRQLALDTYTHLLSRCPKGRMLEVTGTLWVDDMNMEGWKYGSHMWAYLSEILKTPEIGSFNLYEYGVSHVLVYSSAVSQSEQSVSELELLYLVDHLDNWNEHMDREKTAGLNIVYGVHNMIDHSCWTLQDLMNVKSYKTEIKVEYYEDKVDR